MLGLGLALPRASVMTPGGPTLSLTFAGATTLDPVVTFTRALNTATYFDSTGTLQTATANTPRFDYDPSTLAARGLLIEEARTNSIRNNTMQGAVAGTPGTAPTNWTGTAATDLTREVVGTGTENGITYIDLKYSGTVSASRTQYIFFELTNGISASNGQSWAGSAWVKLVAGSLNNITSVAFQADTRDSSLVYVSTPFTAAFTPTSTFTRYSGSGTATGATIAWIQPFVRFITASSGDIDITLRIGLPQLEQGAFATSVIPTTAAAATRNADVASVNTLTPWYNATEGTLFVEYSIVTSRTTDITFTRFDDGSDANRIQLSTGASFTVFNPFVITANVSQGNSVVSINPIGSHKIAAAFQTNSLIGAMDGTLGAEDTVLTMPSGVSRLCVGNSNNVSQFINGYLRRIAYYPRRLSNAELQAITG